MAQQCLEGTPALPLMQSPEVERLLRGKAHATPPTRRREPGYPQPSPRWQRVGVGTAVGDAGGAEQAATVSSARIAEIDAAVGT